MELVYLWVEDYKNIKNQGFNFSPRFTCNYDKDSKELTIDENKEYINIFPENINVTAVVGENGSGKSAILEVLKNDYNLFDKGTLFFIYFDKISNILVFPGLHQEQMNIEDNVFPLTLECSISENISLLEKTRTIFFTHLFHNDYDIKLKTVDLHHTLVANLSTIYELADGDLLEVESTMHDKMRKSDFSKIIRTYNTKQIQKAILSIKHGMKLPFESPNHLKIKNIRTEKIVEKVMQTTQNDNMKTICKMLQTLFEVNLTSWKKSNNLVNYDYLGISLILVFLLQKSNREDDQYVNEFLNIIEKYTNENSIETYFNSIYTDLKERNWEFQVNYNEELTRMHFESEKNYFEKAKLFFDNYNQLNYFHGQGAPISHSLDEIVVEIKTNDFTFLENYLDLIKDVEGFFEFSWLNLSSGEENFLYQFSRFYYLKNYPNFFHGENIKDVKNLIILFDEGETTLHPQWQKQYINYCLEFFKNNFSEYNCHIVFTTHSPFILSDIPRKNVLFLEEGKQKEVNIETFGANIHTLLSHGFFMKDGLMGEFAKEKIQNVINFLNDKTTNLEKKDILPIINMIGEPFLKQKLQEQYDIKYSEERDIENEINALEQKLEKLINVKNSK